MTTKEVASEVGCTERYVQKKAKEAKANNKHIITVKGHAFVLVSTKGASGDEYHFEYHKTTRKTVSKEISFAHLAELDGFDVLATKHTAQEKLLLITFMRKYNYTMKIIIESLLLRDGEVRDAKKIAALKRKFLRWQKDFNAGGASALEDKRGKTRADFMKIDEELLILAIEGAGARGIRENYYGVHDFYCYLWQKKYTDTFTADNEKIISYTSIVKGVQKVFKKHPLIKAYWEKGYDGLLQAYMVGVKDITHINQEWQVDATRFDFMVKVVDADGNIKIARKNLTAVIDVYSGNAVATLTEKIDSYAQVRVLHKAFTRMGLPEQIYMDNGRDYVSQHYSDVLDDLGIVSINAEVGQGRQKGKIERFFGVLQGELAKLPGYIGNDVQTRTKIEDQTASKIDVRTSKATRINESRLLTFEEMDTIVNNVLAKASEAYKAHAHQLLDAVKIEEIRRKLGKKHQRPIHRDGVKLNGMTYVSADLWIKGLATGHKVDVYEDIDDINKVYIYRGETFVAEALNRDLGVEAMSLEAFKAAKKADRKNNIAPVQKDVRHAKELYAAYEDENAAALLEMVPEYAKPVPKEEKPKPVVNNDFLAFVLDQKEA